MKNASVVSPGLKTPRAGRGYSKDELAAAKFSIKEARDAGLIIDLRRQTKYPENVASLKEIKADYAKYLVDKEKELTKIRKANAKARKEAAKRKADDDVTLKEKEKEIEKTKKEVQEEIARREAEELEEEKEEELSEEELSELDDLEETALEDEETPEGALEKLEDDLAESLGDEEKPAEKTVETVAADGTKRVVKRVRKKPTTTTKGATEKAEKKE
jgi:hypothetical protein